MTQLEIKRKKTKPGIRKEQECVTLHDCCWLQDEWMGVVFLGLTGAYPTQRNSFISIGPYSSAEPHDWVTQQQWHRNRLTVSNVSVALTSCMMTTFSQYLTHFLSADHKSQHDSLSVHWLVGKLKPGKASVCNGKFMIHVVIKNEENNPPIDPQKADMEQTLIMSTSFKEWNVKRGYR